MEKFDFIIVGCGLYGAVAANRIRAAGYSCMILEKREHIAGNAYTQLVDGIQVHRYGAHIFHTSDEKVWNFVNQYGRFNHYINSPIANYRGEIYNLPFNMNTFNRMWGVVTPQQAMDKLENQRREAFVETPCNLEEQAINLVGSDIYEKLIRGYTEKQWGRPCTQLPPFIIKRLPVRFTYDNNYFNDIYQGIPVDGYTALVTQMIAGIPLRLNTNFLDAPDYWEDQANCIIYTGPIDEYYDYRYGALQYRSLRFETECLDISNYQGNAVVNYTDSETPFTRIIEHKHFLFGKQPHTIISREYSKEWQRGDEPYYPVNNTAGDQLYKRYADLAQAEKKLYFGGRLGEYRYYDMDKVIATALAFTEPGKLRSFLEG